MQHQEQKINVRKPHGTWHTNNVLSQFNQYHTSLLLKTSTCLIIPMNLMRINRIQWKAIKT